MHNSLQQIAQTEKPIIGMIHLAPTPGHQGAPPIGKIFEWACSDATALESGGVDALLLENNYDLPHRIQVGPETISCMTVAAHAIRQRSQLPLGICTLWNDYKASLAIAKAVGAAFIRIACFVDTVRTSYGEVAGDPIAVLEYRKKLNAEDVHLFVDIHVKHAELLSEHSLEESARLAEENKASAVIVTGKWTADAPLLSDLERVRRALPGFPLLVGSGATESNVASLLRYADGVIVGTALKEGVSYSPSQEVNIKNFEQRIDQKLVKRFVATAREST